VRLKGVLMLYQTAAQSFPALGNLMQPRSARLLIVSDEPKHLKALQAELNVRGVEITNATTPEEVRYACGSSHDLAVVDVAPGKVLDVLETLRGSVRPRHFGLS
jgi:ActR/RegA family two-component response regulator